MRREERKNMLSKHQLSKNYQGNCKGDARQTAKRENKEKGGGILFLGDHLKCKCIRLPKAKAHVGNMASNT